MKCWSFVALVVMVGAPAGAQPRPAPPCAATHHAIALDAADALDPLAAPGLVFVEAGALLVYRDRGGALRLARLDGRLRQVGPVRELGRGVGAFAAARAGAGVALAYVERDEVVLARVSAAGEAQNVPRALARVAVPVNALSLARTPGGYVAAWGTGDGGAWVATTDALGVPSGEPARVGDGARPRVAWQRGLRATSLVVAPSGEERESTAFLLGDGGQVVSRSRWPSGAVGPVALGANTYAVEPGATGAPSLVRIPAGGLAPSDPVASPYEAVAAEAAGAGVAVLLRAARNGRELVARLGPDAAAAAPVVVRAAPSSPGALAVRGDGTVFVVGRAAGAHGGARVEAIELACRR